MGFKKKKNIIILTLCMVVCFILYQLYFFLTITSEAGNNNRVIPVLDMEHWEVESLTHLRSEEDKFINENGVIHGVLTAHMQKYRPNSENEFTCLKIKQQIPFIQMNDDYCDCEDGTDEPSTNACVNGTFYCATQHHNHKPISFNTVPSSRVNDGICDCCDGSDEWLNDPKKKLVSQSNNMYYTYYVSKCLNVCD